MSSKVSIEIKDISELKQVAKKLLLDCHYFQVWAIEGEMGVGKTTLIQEVLRELGIEELEGSPTYSLVNEYMDKNGRNIFHFDLYRIENQEEALNIGIEEMIYSEGLSIIEWPEIVKDLLPIETIWIKLSILDLGKTRLLSYQI
jgi:tRNA threonylcarbamoyladenosine biosynthesis protein TsaE